MAKLLDLSVYGPGHISNILQVDASVYAKAFVTDGGKDTQVVRGDGTLASISSLYVGNADKLDGYHATCGNNNPWGTIPVITTSGWMDVGRQFEFHYDNTTGTDYSTVLRCTGNNGNIVDLPSSSGTLVLTSQIPTSLPANGGNADTVDWQHFSYSNDSNSPTYLWATNSNGTSFLAARGSISVNYANSAGDAEYSQKLQVHDVRSEVRTPNYFDGHRITSWFNNTGTPNGAWYSGIHVKGWSAGYTSWELCSYSSTGTANDYDLYFRSGNNTTWGSWKTIITSGNIGSQHVSYADSAGSVAWGNVTGKPSSFNPSSHTHAKLVSEYGISNEEDKSLLFAYHIGYSESGTPATTDNSNAVITINRHEGGYSSQIGFGSDGRIKYRSYSNQYIVNNVTKVWNTLAYTSEIPTKVSQLTNDSGYLTSLPSHNHDTLYPKKDGTGASGTWGINITGSAGSVAWGNVTGKPSSFNPSSHNHTKILYIDDRDTIETPSDVAGKNGIEIHFKNKSKSSIPSSGTWTAIVMLDGYSDTSGGYPMELGFSMSDISESRPLYLRTPKSSSEWGGWRTILDSNTYTDYTVKKDGTGASGTWGINITGSAGGVAWGNVTGKPSSFNPSSHTHNSIKGSDNRSVNNTPDWYMSNVGHASIYTEFCMSGGAISSTYENRTTFTPWHNNSGQMPVQLAFNNSGMFMRTSSSATAWNAWTTIIHTGNISSQSVNYALSAGNADSVDSQHFSYSNDSNSPTYLWATNSNGSSFLAARGSISVNYANSAGTASTATQLTYKDFSFTSGTTVADYAKSTTCSYNAGTFFSVSNWAWANSSELNVGGYTVDRMRYSAVVYRNGNLNSTWAQHAVMFIPTYSDSNTIYIAQMCTTGTATVSTSVKRYLDYDSTYSNIYNALVNGYASSAGNADTVDEQHFNWNNDRNDHTYLWAASSNGQSYLVHRASISVNYANSAGTSSSVTVNDSNSNSTYRMVWHSGNTLYGTGGIYCNPSTDSLYASAFYETSDERLKDFENDVNVDLNLIRSIPKMYFRWKKNPSELQIGTSAQAVKQLYPELVSSSEEGILSVDYSKLSIVALSAIDKLHLENQGLKHEINILKQEIEKLKGQI